MSKQRASRASRGKAPERLGDFVDPGAVECTTDEDGSDYMPSMQDGAGHTPDPSGTLRCTETMSSDSPATMDSPGPTTRKREELLSQEDAQSSLEPPSKRRTTAEPKYIDLTTQTIKHDPIGRRMAQERLEETAVAENAAAEFLMSTLSVVSTCIVRAEKSVLNGPNKQGVRAMLNSLIKADKAVTTVETRRCARRLIALDREMVATMKALDTSLRTNPRVKSLAYERFLRENPCPVCLEPFVDRQRVMTETIRFQCDHAVHMDCIADWCRTSPVGQAITCPLCRAVEAPFDPRPEPWTTSGHIMDDEPASSESEEEDDDTSGAFRARLPRDPAALSADRVTRSVALQNVADGINPYMPR